MVVARVSALLSATEPRHVRWKNTNDGVEVRVAVPKTTSRSHVKLEVHPKRLRMDVRGSGTILEGTFPTPVEVDECFWILEESDEDANESRSIEKDGGTATERVQEMNQDVVVTLTPKDGNPWKVLMEEELQAGVQVTQKVFLEVTVDGNPVGKMVIGLYGNAVPKTAENFRALCAGDVDPDLCYRKSAFHRIIPGFMCQGGDFTNGDGTGGRSIYGERFPDESFSILHDRPYLMSMANAGPDSNGSQFFITTVPCPHLDGKHVVFGELLSGQEVVQAMEQQGTTSGQPQASVVITDCGVMAEA
mmetsp:Transcript_2019/g.12917  ORF Transcript_2019/g.12917 Transcript_2019/m.12917 type:complete len:304 (+) Transcript_2019:2655-3566(+)